MADKHGAKPERRAEPYAKFQDSQRGGASLHIRRQSRCKGLLGQSQLTTDHCPLFKLVGKLFQLTKQSRELASLIVSV